MAATGRDDRRRKGWQKKEGMAGGGREGSSRRKKGCPPRPGGHQAFLSPTPVFVPLPGLAAAGQGLPALPWLPSLAPSQSWRGHQQVPARLPSNQFAANFSPRWAGTGRAGLGEPQGAPTGGAGGAAPPGWAPGPLPLPMALLCHSVPSSWHLCPRQGWDRHQGWPGVGVSPWSGCWGTAGRGSSPAALESCVLRDVLAGGARSVPSPSSDLPLSQTLPFLLPHASPGAQSHSHVPPPLVLGGSSVPAPLPPAPQSLSRPPLLYNSHLLFRDLIPEKSTNS